MDSLFEKRALTTHDWSDKCSTVAHKNAHFSTIDYANDIVKFNSKRPNYTVVRNVH